LFGWVETLPVVQFMFSGGFKMKKLSLLAALIAVSSTGCNLLPMPSCFNRGDSCPAMGCSAEMGMPMGYDGCADCGPAMSYGVPGYPMPEATIGGPPSSGGLPTPPAGSYPANP